MKVSDAMTPEVRMIKPEDSIQEAARLMADIDVGALPVSDDDRLLGMVTDRDIAVRAVAHGKSPDTKVREVMSWEVMYCFEDQELEDVALNMSDIKVRRLPVVNREKRLVGIISVGDLARFHDAQTTGEALAGISEPGGAHSQTAH
ncbi:MAG TPA: CBS domain-containing protein [Burkholderiales bacterium]|nr:CBS domain-containing protein [Burkholderiales bacterium]